MMLFTLCRSHRRVLIIAGALGIGFGLALLAAPVAQAFTIDDQSNTNRDGSARFSDPAARLSGPGDGGPTTIRQGNTTLQFGTQRPGFGSDQRYNTERMFNPNGRPGDDR